MTPADNNPIVPPEAHATPHDLPKDLEANVPFWLPSWGQSLQYLGWRWLLAVPTALVLAAVVTGAVFDSRFFSALWILGPKWLIVLVALPLVVMGQLVRTAVRHRPDPFCIHCGYSLTGLPDGHRCPECGRAFNLKVIEEYRRDPHWFIQRYRQRHDLPAADAPFAAGKVPSRRSRDGT